jgi:uncharacterized membrane protein
MLPEPLHAAVVHFPIVFAVLLPLVAVLSLVAIRRGGNVRLWWGITVSVMLALAASSFTAVRTGEAEEDRVEDVVGDRAMHTHEEAGERFLVLTGGLLLLGVAGLIPRRFGGVMRAAAVIASVGVLAAGWQVGHSGGELVYRHGAASAYAPAAGSGGGERAADRSRPVSRERRAVRGDD